MKSKSERIEQAGYEFNRSDELWRKDVGDSALVLERAGEGPKVEWWLLLASDTETPRFTFAGSLRACLHLDRKVVKMIREGKLT